MTEDDTFRKLKRKINSPKEMEEYLNKRIFVGDLMLDLEKVLISIGWTLEEWKQVKRDQQKK